MSKHWILNTFKFVIVVGIFFYLYKTDQFKLEKLKAAFERIDLFLIATMLIFIGAFIAVQRWRILLHAQNYFLNLWAAIKLTFVGYFFGAALPGILSGDIVKAYYVTKGEQQKAVLITSIIFDRLLGLYTLVFIAALAFIIIFLYSKLIGQKGVWPHPYIISLGYFSCLLFLSLTIIGLLSISKGVRNSRFLKHMLMKIPFQESILKIYQSIQLYAQNLRLTFNAFIFSLIAQFFTYVGMFLIAVLLEIKMLTPIQYLVILPLGSLINAIPLAPGGLGVGEAGFRTIFLLFGSQEGAEFAIIYHAIFFILALGIGGLVYLFSDFSKGILTEKKIK